MFNSVDGYLISSIIFIQMFYGIYLLTKLRKYGAFADGVNLKLCVDNDFDNTGKKIAFLPEENVNVEKARQSAFFIGLIVPLNSYLSRCGSYSFSSIENFAENTIINKERPISDNLSIPVFLGLLGTIIGITFSLSRIPTGETFDPLLLLSGVRIAMISSATGLFLTTIMYVVFNRIRQKVYLAKNEFLSFVQSIPAIGDNKELAELTCQISQNLATFNETFTSNTAAFKESMNSVEKLASYQMELVDKMRKLDVSKLAKFNLEIIDEFGKIVQSIQTQIDDYYKITSSSAAGIQSVVEAHNNLSKSINDAHNKVDMTKDNMINVFGGAVTQLQKSLEDSFNKSKIYTDRFCEEFILSIKKLPLEVERKHLDDIIKSSLALTNSLTLGIQGQNNIVQNNHRDLLRKLDQLIEINNKSFFKRFFGLK